MKFKVDEFFAIDVILLGRVTYEGFAAAWPSMNDEQGFADRMNGLPKYVVSTTLDRDKWNHSPLIKENVAEVSARNQQPGQDILLVGSADLLHTLMQHDLVDEYRFMLHPIGLDRGKRLFRDRVHTTVLKLEGTQAFSSGVLVLTCRPAQRTQEERRCAGAQ